MALFVYDPPGKVLEPAAVASGMANVVRAVERALRQGDVDTLPAMDEQRIHAVVVRHQVPREVLDEAIDEIRGTRRVEQPLAQAVFRVLGDSGAAVLASVRSRLG